MNCQKLFQHIDDYIANQLDPQLAKGIHNHVVDCADCQQRIEQRKQLTNSLRELPVPPMRAGFVDQAIEQSIQANNSSIVSSPKPDNRWAFSAGFASALAAGFAIWFFVNVFSVNQQPSMQQDPATVADVQSLNIELYESRKVKLLFNSPQAMQNATVSLQLPDHIEVDGYAGRRTLTWSTQLKAGKNVLSLPIRALDIGKGELVTKVEFNGKSKTIRFHVNVNQIHQSKPIEELFLPQINIGHSA